MKVKINEKLICIPPHISCTWEQVRFLQSEPDPNSSAFTLSIHLVDGKEIRIPNLDAALIDIAFAAHMKYLEDKSSGKPKPQEENKTINSLLHQLTGLSPEQLTNLPIRFGISGFEGMPGMEVLQHLSSQSNASDIPEEVLEKITQMIKLMINGDAAAFPKAEPHCNCPHCQVARFVHKESDEPAPVPEPAVSEEDLKFRDWDIRKTADLLYVVTNPLDPKEQYNVYLGDPVGCTCGQPHCEHIKAVLYS